MMHRSKQALYPRPERRSFTDKKGNTIAANREAWGESFQVTES
jgi:hypothetical protein